MDKKKVMKHKGGAEKTRRTSLSRQPQQNASELQTFSFGTAATSAAISGEGSEDVGGPALAATWVNRRQTAKTRAIDIADRNSKE